MNYNFNGDKQNTCINKINANLENISFALLRTKDKIRAADIV